MASKATITTPAQMSEAAFRFFSRLIYEKCGIKMAQSKKTMLEGRLRKRLRALNLASFKDYREYLSSDAVMRGEIAHIMDAVTTNKTDFFREPSHFDFLVEKVLPGLTAVQDKIRVWSAGCSTGEEPYTLAMVMSEFVEKAHMRFSILASDISTQVLEKAKRAVYEHEKIDPVPVTLRRKYLLRGTGERIGFVRIRPELRRKVKFKRLNLMDPRFELEAAVDVIFCRNVMIYFDPPTQEELVGKFCMSLRPGGYLFIGHSETLHGLQLPLEQVAPTVYRRV